ncbi:MAG: hypothetical protein COS92_09300 [Desulfobacterales bacterium CG07_land_8_20_14_0_80_52_14]|nr:MAG: hypothetical protein COX20_08510 [Desulfobacterales bacterium CG23_combo_of_CG06-09_8_20_14_all_52_9]PIU48952.1 MAG: hypothetical protein COS92_09300 [Desulfobacterales bacterium CG07_land_8_20_14_0_80_52_14]
MRWGFAPEKRPRYHRPRHDPGKREDSAERFFDGGLVKRGNMKRIRFLESIRLAGIFYRMNGSEA